jgi:sulfate permease, SulP family
VAKPKLSQFWQAFTPKLVIVAGIIAAHGYAGLVLATLLAGFILIAALMLLAKLWPQFIGAERATTFQAALDQVSAI